MLFGFLYFTASAVPEGKFLLAKNAKPYVVIRMPLHNTETLNFAAAELSQYLLRISGAVFSIVGYNNSKPAILIQSDPSLDEEEYQILVQGHNIILSGGSGRAVLYAVYDFLQRLGCVWIAPELDFYKGSSEYVPKKSTLFYGAAQKVKEHPQLKYRKIDVEEGRTHNMDNLKQIIEWMPKARFNILMTPLDYGGGGRVRWDNWRKQLVPELKKRGLLIEVGGHGYQNFLNAGMEDSTIFRNHPGWFGKDKNCNPSPAEYRVFNTGDSGAVNYLISRILTYIKGHPEIDIFDFWPPDGAHWADCPEFKKLGSPVDRQALLVNQVDAAIKKIRPGLRLEMIAYQPVLMPPEKVQLNKNILVDFCPINQSFEKQIYDSGSANNYSYDQALKFWRHTFKGDIGLYSYYRKYAWHSLPNVIPHYIQKDMEWYSKLPLQGISTYAEPGDWFTYELNHYILGHTGWDSAINIDSLIDQYCILRYGRFHKTARDAYTVLENIVPHYCSIPFSTLKPTVQITQSKQRILNQIRALHQVRLKCDGNIKENVSRLLLMMQYAYHDLEIQELISASGNTGRIEGKIKELSVFLGENKDKGLFIISTKDELTSLMNHYKMNKRVRE